MSHRTMDEAAEMERRIAALDKEIAAKSLQPVVGIKVMIELKRMRQQLAQRIAMLRDGAE